MGNIEAPVPQTVSSYSVLSESKRLLTEALLNNPKIAKDIPPDAIDFAPRVTFTGSEVPSVPVNWRFAESVASLKAFEACIVSALLKRKYNVKLTGASINIDHAQLFFMSAFTWQINPGTEETISLSKNLNKMDDFIPNYDFHKSGSSLYRTCVTNIYQTKDRRFFHLHGSMNPNPSLESIGLPIDCPELKSWEDAIQPFTEKLATIDSDEMQHLASDVYKQAGVIAETVDSFRASEHGKSNAHVGLFEIHEVLSPSHKASWWTPSAQTSPERPLAGLKVIDLTRVIAAPAATRGLAELGASVMRVTSPNLVDRSSLHIDLNWGKWNCSLDLKTDEGKEKLRSLIREADVVIQGYRPGVLDKYGFSQDAIIDMVKHQPRGIISVRENCYGWHGPWSYRSGWQQISDACVGISAGFGKAMGLTNDEPVTPVFPNSDYMTGIAGTTGVLCALMRQSEKGGSYKVDVALNYYNQWLADSVGEYPEQVWQDLWRRNGNQVFRSYHNMNYMIPKFIEMITKNNKIISPSFFEDRESKAIGKIVRTPKPVIKYDNDQVQLKYNVGTRGNGKDAPHWPVDLMTEVVQ